MPTEHTTGKIVTFYSFKGGVGRTMALANVGFLSALNGLRVLVMDWDLEAPGLGYYFRGLLETPDAKSLKDAPGVLDILWEWRREFTADKSQADIDFLLTRFRAGKPFQACVQTLPINLEGVLDYIGAGSQKIATPELMPYEAALANFSWSSFFEQESGGHVIDSLRNWAKSHYDLILIDSRTGLADAAGICTMQIPDVVALCFILNRQNIDGIAKVAAALRANGSKEISLRAVPMRIARQDTSEESDARARALWELRRVGGFADETIQNDFRELAVVAADNVPFYETLAPFAATNPSYDPLTLNYLALASKLLDKNLAIPLVGQEWIKQVRRHLQPRHATVDYLLKLQSADPTRAVTELDGLTTSAFDAVKEGRVLEEGYLDALDAALLPAFLGIVGDGIDLSPIDAEKVLKILVRTVELREALKLKNSTI